MKTILHTILIGLVTMGIYSNVNASTCETTGSGKFDQNSNWSCGSGYTTADTLIIKHEMEIQNNNQINIQASVMIITSNNNLEFGANSKLFMNTPGGEIHVQSNATIFTDNNSSGSLIEINNVPVWGNACSTCNNATIFGPTIIMENASPGNPSLLPVDLLSFEADLRNRVVELTWSTTEEINNDFFTIYRSNDGQAWEAIGTVQGAGTTSIDQYYSFKDEEYTGGEMYYKLKQTDFDGQFTYTDVVNVKSDARNFSFYPNPANAQVTVTGSNQPFTVNLVDNTGKMIKSISGEGQRSLDVSDVPAGMYMLIFQHGNTTLSEKLIIQ